MAGYIWSFCVKGYDLLLINYAFLQIFVVYVLWWCIAFIGWWSHIEYARVYDWLHLVILCKKLRAFTDWLRIFTYLCRIYALMMYCIYWLNVWEKCFDCLWSITYVYWSATRFVLRGGTSHMVSYVDGLRMIADLQP